MTGALVGGGMSYCFCTCNRLHTETVLPFMHVLDNVPIETEYFIAHIFTLQYTFLILGLVEFSGCMGGHNALLYTIKHKC
jgi:hypothetical protein